MNFRQVDAFRAVMQTGSMTVAAGQLHTSQPNVSRAVAQLQRETGLKLFARVGLRLVPTPEAQALLQEIDRVYLGMQTIRDAAERIRVYGVGGLRVAVSSALANGLVPHAIEAFRAARPQATVNVLVAESATICRWVSGGYCDVGLAAQVALPQEVRGDLVHADRAVCIVPGAHRLARRRKVTPADLAGESFISLPSYDPAREAIDRLFKPEVRRLEIEVAQASAICVMVGRGLGVSLMSPRLHDALSVAGVKAIPFEPAILFKCYSVRAKQRPEQALVEDFLAAVRQVAKQRER